LSKFFLIFLLAKNFSAADLGSYGLIFSLVGFITIFSGFEIYSEYSRDLVTFVHGNEPDKIYNILNKLTINLISIYSVFFIFFCLYCFYFDFELFKWGAIIIFIALFEHYSLELMRTLNAMGEQVFASVNLLIRTGAWVYPLYVWGLIFETVELFQVLLFWITGAVVSSMFSLLYIFKKLGRYRFKVSLIESYRWFIKSMKIAFPLFISAIIIRFLPLYERGVIDVFYSLELVGTYTLFSSLTNVIFTMLEAVFLVFFIPKMLLLHEQGKIERMKVESNNLLKLLIISGGVLCFIVYMMKDLVLDALGKPEFKSFSLEFFLMLANICVILVSTVFQLYLYASKQYSIIYKIIIFHLAQSLLLIGTLGYLFSFLGVVVAVLLCNMSLLLIRYYFSYVKRSNEVSV
jgi:O-antigen/teichoic acid export membrane protein